MYQYLFIVILAWFCLLQSSTTAPPDVNTDPKFSAPITNVTVAVGRDATLTCKVHDLGSYRVAWVRIDTQTILTIQNHVITKNHRISVSHTEHRIWQLKIRDVLESDRGWYMCQLNTDPMRSQTGFMDVVVPPDIVDSQTSHDMVVEEGQNVTLTCSATGTPMPTITWRREKEMPILSVGAKEIFSSEGQNLSLRNVNRHYMGAYLCIASNGVPPSVSKRVLLVVNFAPTIWTRHNDIHAFLGQKIVLECITESHPTSVNYWLRDKEFIQGGTYESVTLENVFKIVMRLTIRPTKVRDFGDYKCIAKNALGESHRTVTVHQKFKSDLQISPQKGETDNSMLLAQNEIYTNDISSVTTNFPSRNFLFILTIVLCSVYS